MLFSSSPHFAEAFFLNKMQILYKVLICLKTILKLCVGLKEIQILLKEYQTSKQYAENYYFKGTRVVKLRP